MPTGYTANVQNGKITEAKEYILQCAKAFGALIMMRDESFDKEIPEAFEIPSYHKDALEEAKKKLEEVEKLTEEEIKERIDLEHWNKVESNKRYREEVIQQGNRYREMLVKVTEWNPPTSEHIKLKEFCISQLQDSIKHDCYSEGELDRYYPIDPPKQSVDEWIKSKTDSCKRDITYHTEEHKKEIERFGERNMWIKQLRESL